jgi:cyclohexanone monooxygenase
MIEAQIEYVIDALRVMEEHGVEAVDVRPEVQSAFNAEVQSRMPPTVWLTGGCASWYLDPQGRNTTLWPDFTFRFRRHLRRFDLASYRALERVKQPA